MFNIGAISASLVLDDKKWKKTMRNTQVDMSKLNGAIKRNADSIKKLGRTMTVVGASITVVSGLLIKMSADVEESENLFEVSMGNMANSTRAWSNELSKSLKLNQFEVRKTVGIFNVMTKSMGLSEQAAFQMSKEMTQLGFDMASFFNLSPDVAFQKLQAAIAGESEPLKRLGIIVNETTTKTWALNNGLLKQGQVMTEAQKVIARYGVIMEATQASQGDLERTLGSTTNRLRTLSSIAVSYSVTLGQKLLPSVNMLVGGMIILVQSAQIFADTFPDLTSAIVVSTAAFGLLMLALGPILIALPGIAAAAVAMGLTIKVAVVTSTLFLFKFALAAGAVFLVFKKWDFLKSIFFNFSAGLNGMLSKATKAIANFVEAMAKIPLIGDQFKGLRNNLNELAQDFQKNSEFMKNQATESYDAQMEKDKQRLEQVVLSNEEISISFKEMWDKIADESEKANEKLKGGMKDWLEDLKKDFKVAEEVGRRTFNLLADTMSDIFFDAMTGEIKSFQELFADFGRGILRIMADIAAQWIAVKIITGIGGAIGGISSSIANAGGALADIGGKAVSSGVSSISGALNSGLDASFSNMQGLSLGSFSDGLDRVPTTGFYKVHKDEQIIPARFNETSRAPIELTIENHITPEGIASALVKSPAKDTVVNIIDQNAFRNGAIRQKILER